MFRAVGNPDIGDGSVLTNEMDAAITSGDIASVDRVAAAITSELETGRERIGRGVRVDPGVTAHGPARPRVCRFEKMTEAKRAAAGQGLDVARNLGQETLGQSGAIDAWFALICPGVLDETRRAIQAARPADVPAERPNVPTGI